MPFSSLMKDPIEVHKQTGEIIKNLRGSVQRNKIFMDAGKIFVEAGDEIVRTTSVGHVERYEVLDPGFYEGFGGIPANYQMKVRNVAERPQSTSSSPVQVTNNYNVSGANARITHGSDHSTNYVSQISTEITSHLIELREAVQAAPGLTADQVREALEIVDEVSEHCKSKSPKRSVVQAMISALPAVASIAKAGGALLALLA